MAYQMKDAQENCASSNVAAKTTLVSVLFLAFKLPAHFVADS